METLLVVSAVAAVVGMCAPALAQIPDGYDPTYAQTVDSAALEGVVTIYTTTDETETAGDENLLTLPGHAEESKVEGQRSRSKVKSRKSKVESLKNGRIEGVRSMSGCPARLELWPAP